MLTHITGMIVALAFMADLVLLIALVVVASATGDSERYIPGTSTEGPLGTALFLTLLGLVFLEISIRALTGWVRGDRPPRPPQLVPPAVGDLVGMVIFAVIGSLLLVALSVAIDQIRRQGGPLDTPQLRVIVGIVVAWLPAIPIRTLLLNAIRKPTTRCRIEDGAVTLRLPYVDVGAPGLRWRPVHVPFADLDSVRILPEGDPTMLTLLGETVGSAIWKAILLPRIELVLDAIRPRTRWEGDLVKPTILVWRMPFGVQLELRGPGRHYVVTAHPDDAQQAVAAFAQGRAA